MDDSVIVVATLIVLVLLACQFLWDKLNQQSDSTLNDFTSEIKRIGEASRRHVDEASEDYLNKLREYMRR